MVRYAVPVKTKEFLTNTKKIEDLYKEPYFSDRFKIFCNITLKSFAQQTNKNFILLVYHTVNIPKDKKALFDQIEKQYSFVKCLYIKDDNLYIPKELQEDKQLTFRIDNDDGIAIDFIEKLEKVKQEANDINFVITIPKIRKIMRIDKDRYKTISFIYPKKTHSMGLAYYSNTNKTAMDLGDHTTVYDNYPTKVLNGQGGLQILNGYNVGNSIGNARYIMDKNKLYNLLIQENYADLNLEALPIVKDKAVIKKLKKNKL